jgi:hypothetical protein
MAIDAPILTMRAQTVLSTRDRLEVIGIDTASVAAEMVKFHACRDRAFEMLEAEPVRRDTLTLCAADIHMSVAATRHRGSP